MSSRLLLQEAPARPHIWVQIRVADVDRYLDVGDEEHVVVILQPVVFPSRRSRLRRCHQNRRRISHSREERPKLVSSRSSPSAHATRI